jgi:hypothetical protein
MRATNRTNAYAYDERISMLILIFPILEILILLDGILGFYSNKSLPPLLENDLISRCCTRMFFSVASKVFAKVQAGLV